MDIESGSSNDGTYHRSNTIHLQKDFIEIETFSAVDKTKELNYTKQLCGTVSIVSAS